MKFQFVALLFLFIFFLGCERATYQRSSSHQVEWAYQLIDDGRYDEAIQVFSNLLQEEDTATIRLGLASAYAARAGILVESYWAFALPSITTKAPPNLAKLSDFRTLWDQQTLKLTPELRARLSEKSDALFKMQDSLIEWGWRFGQLPSIQNQKQKSDILTARLVIENLTSKGISLYRALLSLILLKHELNESKILFHKSLAPSAQWPCTLELRAWLLHVHTPLQLIPDIIKDLKRAYPSKAIEIEPFERDFQKVQMQQPELLRTLEQRLCPSNSH